MKYLLCLFLLLMTGISTAQTKSSFEFHIGVHNSFAKRISDSDLSGVAILLETKPYYLASFGVAYNFHFSQNSIFSLGIDYLTFGHKFLRESIFVLEPSTVELNNRFISLPIKYRYETSEDQIIYFVEAGLNLHYYVNSSSSSGKAGVRRRREFPGMHNFTYGFQFGFGVGYFITKEVQLYINPNYKTILTDDSFHAVDDYRNFGVDFGIRITRSYIKG